MCSNTSRSLFRRSMCTLRRSLRRSARVLSATVPARMSITGHANAGRRAAPAEDNTEECGRTTTPPRRTNVVGHGLAQAEITAQRLLGSARWASCDRFSSREHEKADTTPSCRRQNCTARRCAGPPNVSRDGTRVQVRLTKKLAEAIDGIDLSDRRVGDVVDLPTHDAQILLAEGWASPVEPAFGARARRTDANDRPRRPTKNRPR